MNRVLPLVALLLALMLTPVLAFAAPTFTVEATLDKPAYYAGETAVLTVKLTWSGLSQSYTMKYVVLNSTGAEIYTLSSSVSVTGNNGSKSDNFNLPASTFTNAVGEKTYELRVVDTGSGLTVASAKFTVRVKSEEILISVAWDDSSGDRLVEPYETVNFNIFVTWTFVNASKTLALYADSRLIDNVQISQGSGSAQKTYVTTFDSEGAHYVSFTLQDSAGKIVAQKSVGITVGTKPTEKAASIIDQASTWLKQNSLLVIVFLALVLIAVIVVKHR
jgi:hypothetical protein